MNLRYLWVRCRAFIARRTLRLSYFLRCVAFRFCDAMDRFAFAVVGGRK